MKKVLVALSLNEMIAVKGGANVKEIAEQLAPITDVNTVMVMPGDNLTIAVTSTNVGG